MAQEERQRSPHRHTGISEGRQINAHIGRPDRPLNRPAYRQTKRPQQREINILPYNQQDRERLRPTDNETDRSPDNTSRRQAAGYPADTVPRHHNQPVNTEHPRHRNQPVNTAHPHHRNQPVNTAHPRHRNRPADTDRPYYSQPALSEEALLRRRREMHRRQQLNQRRKRNFYRKLIKAAIYALGSVLGFALLFRLLFIDNSSRQTDNAAGTLHQEELDNDGLQAVPLRNQTQGLTAAVFQQHPAWEEDFLTINDYSRPGTAIKEVNNIFVHYTANPSTSAAQNRSYFENLKNGTDRSASAHFIIGYEGEIIQCIPLTEMAYAVQTRNEDSISIECCYISPDGSFTPETYQSLIKLLGWLSAAYDLDEQDILRHYDSGGKKCPLYYTEHEDAWERLKSDVKNTL